MADRISVLLVDDISSTLDNLRKLLSFEDDIDVAGTAANGREAVEEARRLNPDIVLMDVNMPEMDGIQATEMMASVVPNSPVIIMSVQGERDYLRRAMQSGAREFLIKPFSGDELIASVRRVHQLEQRKETYARAEAGATAAPEAAAPEVPAEPAPEPIALADPAPAPPAAPAPAPAPPPAHRDAEPAEAPTPAPSPAPTVAAAAETPTETPPPAVPLPRRTTVGELIVLFGGKGGVGKSVLAANLATSLAKETGARVALVDLDLQFGDIGVLLNLPQNQSIADLIENIDQVDADYMVELMPEASNGVRVLTTPPSPELADLVTPEHVQRILADLRGIFDFVVVDTSSHLGDITLAALDMATRIVLVTALSIPAVKNAKLALRLFETLSLPTANTTLVLNRCEAHTEFNKDSIESHLKFPISVQIPHDPRTVVNSINRGLPFVVSNPEAEVSQRIRQLVAVIQPERIPGAAAAAVPARRGLRFGRK